MTKTILNLVQQSSTKILPFYINHNSLAKCVLRTFTLQRPHFGNSKRAGFIGFHHWTRLKSRINSNQRKLLTFMNKSVHGYDFKQNGLIATQDSFTTRYSMTKLILVEVRSWYALVHICNRLTKYLNKPARKFTYYTTYNKPRTLPYFGLHFMHGALIIVAPYCSHFRR